MTKSTSTPVARLAASLRPALAALGLIAGMAALPAQGAEAATAAAVAAAAPAASAAVEQRAAAPAAPSAKGGPLFPAAAATEASGEAQFKSLFMTWKKLDTMEQGVIAIPSVQPVDKLTFTSNFGIRSDPFRGTAAMHAGVDIPGPTGTPIYATADGIVSTANRQGGYGNLIEVNHGKGIATRYAHLSKILVSENSRVRRGQIIGLMGSTGRSTGPHLHYEVRIDGHAVNPIPFLTTADYLLASRDTAIRQIPVSTTGPAPQD